MLHQHVRDPSASMLVDPTMNSIGRHRSTTVTVTGRNLANGFYLDQQIVTDSID